MPGMKVTVDAAMRARDVSRPHAEHEDVAEASEPQPTQAREPGRAAPTVGTTGSAAAPAAAGRSAQAGGVSKARSPRRRRRHR
jgi:hypothetical protein